MSEFGIKRKPGKSYVLRKCKEGGMSFRGFKHPTKIGEWVEAPDWDPTPRCGGGIHGLLEAQGIWNNLQGSIWQVYEVDPREIVKIDFGKCKFRKGQLVYYGRNGEPLKTFFKLESFKNESAFYWALYIGDREVMRDRITDPKWVYYWILYMGEVVISL